MPWIQIGGAIEEGTGNIILDFLTFISSLEDDEGRRKEMEIFKAIPPGPPTVLYARERLAELKEEFRIENRGALGSLLEGERCAYCDSGLVGGSGFCDCCGRVAKIEGRQKELFA